MQEVWKDIAGYEGLYQVSNLGRVKSLDRYVAHKKYGKQFHAGKILKPKKRKKGENYLTVDLTKNSTRKSIFVHRLVAINFLGEKEGMEVNHIDEDPTNNRLDNLEWLTHNENMHHKDLFKRIKKPNKKPVNAYDKEGNLIFSFDSIEDAGRNGFNSSAISQNISGKLKTSGGYVWKEAK